MKRNNKTNKLLDASQCPRGIRGVAMVEFAISLFVLIPLCFGLWESGRALIAYQELAQVAKEVNKQGVRDATLEVADCSKGSTSSGVCFSHADLHRRMVDMLDDAQWATTMLKPSTGFEFSTELRTVSSTELEFIVKISGKYESLILPLLGDDFTVSLVESAKHTGFRP